MWESACRPSELGKHLIFPSSFLFAWFENPFLLLLRCSDCAINGTDRPEIMPKLVLEGVEKIRS